MTTRPSRPAGAVAAGAVYLDHNATTPVAPGAAQAAWQVLAEDFGNPSSQHGCGARALGVVARARRQVAGLIGARGDEIVFTASGSEADALAIRGVVLGRLRDGATTSAHVVTQVTEHPAVLAACSYLHRWHGVDITYVPVDHHGRVDPGEVRDALRPDTVLVSVMHANNETGTIQPIADIAELTQGHGALLHTDAAQSAGKVALDVDDLGVDLLTIVGHKMYAPKGVAALYVRRGTAIEPVVGGGGQESGRRAGTESTALIAALGVAAELAALAIAGGESERQRRLRDSLYDELAARLPQRVTLNGHPEHRLPNTLNLSVAGVAGRDVLAHAPGVAASTGSACHAAADGPSTGLMALGLSAARAVGALRLSVGRDTTHDLVRAAAGQLVAAVELVTRPGGAAAP